MRLFRRLSQSHGAVSHAEIACYWALTTNNGSCLGLWTGWPTKDADTQNTIDVLDGSSELFHLPNPILAVPLFAISNVLGDEQGVGKWSIDDEEILVGFDGPGFGHVAFSNGGACTGGTFASQHAQSLHDLASSLGFDFDGDGGPLCDETMLELPVI